MKFIYFATEGQTHSKHLAQRQKNNAFSAKTEDVGVISKYAHN